VIYALFCTREGVKGWCHPLEQTWPTLCQLLCVPQCVLYIVVYMNKDTEWGWARRPAIARLPHTRPPAGASVPSSCAPKT